MPDWAYILLLVAGVLIVPLLLSYFVIFTGSAKPKRLDDPAKKHRDPFKKAMKYDGWAQGNGYQLLGCYAREAGMSFMSVWKEQDSHRYLTVTVASAANRILLEFTTMFSEKVELATSDHLDTWGYPRRDGDYCQAFPKARLLEIWERHVAAEQYLIDQGRLVWYDRPDFEFEDKYDASIKEQVRFIRSFPLWQYRLWYWMTLKKHRYAKLSIQDQHERGWIRMPYELGIHET